MSQVSTPKSTRCRSEGEWIIDDEVYNEKRIEMAKTIMEFAQGKYPNGFSLDLMFAFLICASQGSIALAKVPDDQKMRIFENNAIKKSAQAAAESLQTTLSLLVAADLSRN